MAYRFEWDEEKAKSNWIRHGVSFDEATTVFDDSLARIFDDELHSADERREIIIGHSINNRLLIVCFTERRSERIRIINARLHTPKERKAYEENVDF
ncbi:MAG: BrnT family toxin [Acidobacteriota bacterium]